MYINRVSLNLVYFPSSRLRGHLSKVGIVVGVNVAEPTPSNNISRSNSCGCEVEAARLVLDLTFFHI